MSSSLPVILASSSPYKRRLMERLPVDVQTVSPGVDEVALDGESPSDLARRLAVAKARTVADDHPGRFVIGSDQVAALDDEILGKPGSRQRAIEQLLALQGRTHRLITAVGVAASDGSIESTVVTYEMDMRPLSRDQIAGYVDDDTPLDCAGSYKIEAGGIRLFTATRGSDPTAIEGLALTRVWSLLLSAGIDDG